MRRKVRNCDGAITEAATEGVAGGSGVQCSAGESRGLRGDFERAAQSGPRPDRWTTWANAAAVARGLSSQRARADRSDIPVVTPNGNLTLGTLTIDTMAGRTNALLRVTATIPADFPQGTLPFVIGPAAPGHPVWTDFFYVAR